MSIARFFIDRPVFAWVLAIAIMIGGVFAIESMPLEQYPDVAPPAIMVSATYAGASAQTVEDTVVQVLEQQMTGLDNLLYMSSSSSSSGSATVTLSFKPGTNADIAQVQVQNKVQAANSRLPSTVQQAGVTINKSSGNIGIVMALVSDDGRYTSADLSDYLASNLVDPLSRLSGVGGAQQFGSQHAMRIWLNPELLHKYALMPSDVESAIQAQNQDLATGELGGLPARRGQQLNATITARSRLQSVEQFRDILLKSDTGGAQVLLGDVARVEMGSDSYSSTSTINGKPAAGLGIDLAAGANAISVADAIKSFMAEQASTLPQGVSVAYPYETTPFVKVSLKEVVLTLVEAIALVVAIMFLFLQSARATLIPTIAVPVVLLGTFGVLHLFGYSINTLTMFGVVLAIGLLVDDAIVVVENVERVMSEHKLSPIEATRRSMDEVSGALIGIAMVLSAVLVPMAFFPGSTGIIYRQFSVAIVAAMGLSVLVALTLTPALCATFLRPKSEDRPRQGFGHRFFAWFNRTFETNSGRYHRSVERLLHRRAYGYLVYGLAAVAMVLIYQRLPSSFLPTEDQGVLVATVQMPPGSTIDRTQKFVDQATQYLGKQPEIDNVFVAMGFSPSGSGQNSAMMFLRLKDWSQRKREASQIASDAFMSLSQLRDGSAFVVQPPAIQSLGESSGFDMELKDSNGAGHTGLMDAMNKLLAGTVNNQYLTQVRYNGMQDQPQYLLEVDDRKAGAMDLGIDDINATLSAAYGGDYVNDFLDRGRVKRVYVMGDADYRMSPETIGDWYVRNSDSTMVPVSAFAAGKWTSGPPSLGRYNGSSAVEITGDAPAGVSSGTAMQEMQRLTQQLPKEFSVEWTGLSYQERQAGSQSLYLYGASVVFVFLCLAALYESWSVPVSVMLMVPIGALGVALATWLRGLENNIYFQVGLLTTIGLSAKNAILIVEFAKQLEEAGHGLLDATLQAVQLRLRPIVMTSLAFLLGVTPLVVSTGAGAGARQAIGTGVFGGTLLATALGIFLIPLSYVTVRSLTGASLNKRNGDMERPL